MLVSKNFCPDIFVFFFLSPTHLDSNFFVQNVFLKILFPNFYSNFFFPFSAFIIFLDKKYWFKLLIFSFFLEFFSFSQSSVCLIFFLEFLLCHKFWFQFFIQNLFGIFLDKKIDSNFYFISFFDINLFIICIM